MASEGNVAETMVLEFRNQVVKGVGFLLFFSLSLTLKKDRCHVVRSSKHPYRERPMWRGAKAPWRCIARTWQGCEAL
jgi:hypothetical protein